MRLASASVGDLASALLVFLTGEPVDRGVRVAVATVDQSGRLEVALEDSGGGCRRVVLQLEDSTSRIPFHYRVDGSWCVYSGLPLVADGWCPGGCTMRGAVGTYLGGGAGRCGLLELEIRAWRDEDCWHQHTRDGALGTGCADCGMVTDPNHPDERCLDHERGSAGHRYQGVRGGVRPAQHVGLICDGCAAGHLAEYLIPTSIDGGQQR